MLTVACVLKSGGIYDASWVERLRDGVARHLQSDYRFVCLSDVAVPCDRIPLEHDWPGWWAKIETFKLPGPVLYFDLDTAIVGDLSDIAAQAMRPGFTVLRDFYRLGDGVGAGIMGWSSGTIVRDIYGSFAAIPELWMNRPDCKYGGDQIMIQCCEASPSRFIRWQDVLPNQIVSYKVHCRNGIPPDARVVCLHGKPKLGTKMFR